MSFIALYANDLTVAAPLINILARSASSIDNAHAVKCARPGIAGLFRVHAAA